MAVARAKGLLLGRQPKLSTEQQADLRRMHASGDYSIADLAELFTVSRPTVYRILWKLRRPLESQEFRRTDGSCRETEGRSAFIGCQDPWVRMKPGAITSARRDSLARSGI